MCGIAGGTIAVEHIRAMAKRLEHRGPDAQGFYHDEQVTLAHNRLAIIDLEKRANQPMIDGDYVIVYNGEIYNFNELRRELIGSGEVFLTQSDTEVLLKLYRRFGCECLAKLNGDFAFCIYDRLAKKLFCARDRVGNKPFYYFCQDGQFAFASEIPAFLEIMPLEFNTQRLGDAILFGINDHTENTIYRNICNLSPATWLEYNLEKKSLRTGCYWVLPERVESKSWVFNSRSVEQKTDELEFLLEDAVRLRLIADVKVGCLVSGGLDSSVIAALIVKNHGDVDFFHCDHPDYPEISEKKYVQVLSDHHGMRVQDVTSDSSEFLSDWPRFVRAQFDVFRSLTVYCHYVTLKKSSPFVKVMLSGQGADELFGGYWHHQARFAVMCPGSFFYRARVCGLRQAWREMRQGLRLALPRILKQRSLKRDNRVNCEKLQMILSGYEPDFDLLLEKFIFHPRDALRGDTLKFILPQLLRYEDRNAMAFSVENRTPFTDWRVMEFAHALPDALLYHKGRDKFLLRELAKRHLPDSLSLRVDKLGFVAPERDWMREVGVENGDFFSFRLRTFEELYKLCRSGF